MEKKTVVITSYQAIDGVVFNDECECLKYEDLLLREHTKFVDANFNPCKFEESEFVIVKDEIGVRALEEYCKDQYTSPWEHRTSYRHPGYFRYIEDTDSWIDVEEVFTDIVSTYNKLYDISKED